MKPSAPPIPVKARTQEEAAGKAQQAYAAQQYKAPPMPVKAKTQEKAAQKAQQAYAAKPKAEAKTGRNFFERLRPEKVCSEADVSAVKVIYTGCRVLYPICAFGLHVAVDMIMDFERPGFAPERSEVPSSVGIL